MREGCSEGTCPDCGYMAGDELTIHAEREAAKALRAKVEALTNELAEAKESAKKIYSGLNSAVAAMQNKTETVIDEVTREAGLKGAAVAWKSVLRCIASGVPVEGLRIIAEQNLRGLNDLLAGKEPDLS